LIRAAILAVLLLALAASPAARAQSPSPSPSRTPSPAPQPSASATPKPPKPDEWNQALRLFDQLSMDQQAKFLNNLDQWKAMSPEEQELYRDRELFRREKIAEEIQQAISKSGLRLDDDQREVYVLRYTQERRKIEEALRKEMDQKRQAMVTDLLARLKVEFTATPSPAGTPAGSPGGQ
jgi:hypothetical protein